MHSVKSIPNKFKKICASAVIASSLMVPSAHAVTPDQNFALSGIWTTAVLLSEYLDWRAALGWGSVGATNVLVTYLNGASAGQMTKASFSALCGTTAAALMVNWKPSSAPGFRSHMIAVARSATIVGAATACGWVSLRTFDIINEQAFKANVKYELAPGFRKNRVNSEERAINFEHSVLQTSMKSLEEANNWLKTVRIKYRQANCAANSGTQQCSSLRQDIVAAGNRLDASLNAVNEHGRSLSAGLQQIGAELGA